MPVAPGRSMAKLAILKMYVNEITDQEEVPAENMSMQICRLESSCVRQNIWNHSLVQTSCL